MCFVIIYCILHYKINVKSIFVAYRRPGLAILTNSTKKSQNLLKYGGGISCFFFNEIEEGWICKGGKGKRVCGEIFL